MPQQQPLIDFSTFEKDLEELKADPKVREALQSGVELTNYAAEIEKELDKLVNDSIPDYVKEAPETAALHAEIEGCDQVLESIESILNEFQRDLGGISEEIRDLQEQSLSMGVQLKNRKDLETRVRCFLERITVPEDLVKDICEKDVTQEYSQITLKRLDEHMNFAREREIGLLLLKTDRGGMMGSPKEGTSMDIRLPVAPCETAAAADVEPQLEKLRLRAIAKIRTFFMDRISLLKKPSTNVQIMQQDLVRFRYAAEFLQRHAPNVAEEVRYTYVDCMKNILVSLFRTYHAQLMKLVPTQSSLTGALGGLGGGQAAAAQADLIASLQRRPDPMPLAQREQETGAPDAPPIVIHLSQNKKFPYEATFRSEQKHLIDSATSEYLFLLDFFGSAAAATVSQGPARGEQAIKKARQTAEQLFEQVLGKTIQHLIDQVDAYLATATDAVSLLIMIKIVQAHRATMRRRRVVVLETYFDTLDQKLWPQLKRLIDANIKSIISADPKKLMGPKLELQAHHWVRKYALFAASVYSVASELGENSDGSIPRALDIARTKAVELLEKMAALHPSAKTRAVYMINSCDVVLATFGEIGRVQPADAQKFEDLLNLSKDRFVEEEVQEYFGRMIRFVHAAEKDPASINDSEVKELVIDFATNWRSGADLINASVATFFPSFANQKEILGLCLAQMILYYERFREIAQDRPSVKNSRSAKLVERSTLVAEVERYSKGL